MKKLELEVYQDHGGKQPFWEWFHSLKDIQTQVILQQRLRRIELGLFGDFKSLGNGIFGWRFHTGPGYRIYFGKLQKKAIVLLVGGNKRSQNNDIKKAKRFWKDYKENLT